MKTAIVGLGNPGSQYKNTRHNIGFRVLEAYMEKNHLSAPSEKTKLKAHVTVTPDNVFAMPDTFMNRSGESVQALLQFYKIRPETELIVIHDDLDIPLGEIKIQSGKGPAGHHGIESIIQSVGTMDFWRMRIGIAGSEKDAIPGEKYVLGAFSPPENKIVADIIIPRCIDAASCYLKEGPEQTAARYNKKS